MSQREPVGDGSCWHTSERVLMLSVGALCATENRPRWRFWNKG